MADIDTLVAEPVDALKSYRVAMMEELGFGEEDARKLADATKVETRTTEIRTYSHDVPVYWGEIKKMLDAGATHDQVLRIIL